jgi:ribA/ribD-fused uncharacterized protein
MDTSHFFSKPIRTTLTEYATIAKKDTHAEFECKVLAGQIQTKDVADRMIATIQSLSSGSSTEEHRATFSYADGLRVSVEGPENIHKVCSTNSFRGVQLSVERKRRYFEIAKQTTGASNDMIDIPDLQLRFTLRHEEPLRKDFTGAPMDPTSHARILHRKSWTTMDGILRIDLSMVKSKTKSTKSFADILKQTPAYELELEVVNRSATADAIVASFITHVEPLLASFQQSPFLLAESDIKRYRMEFELMKMPFVNPVTLERRHVNVDRPHNILNGYTVTNKADGERCFLVVTRDKRVLRITPSMKITWTGLTASKDNHINDVVDGEYLADRNLFCIFDMYSFRGKDVRRLPLLTTDEDVLKNPTKSRIGCALEFVKDLNTDFIVLPSKNPIRIETKRYLAGNGAGMEEAIRKTLDTKYEYPTDGLIFTPRASAVAPVADRQGKTWLRVYKWKPPHQNSIDFLLRYKPGENYDPVLSKRVFAGSLYVSRSPGTDIIYPCETMTGEYVPPEMPLDLRHIAQTRDRIPSFFQPSVPRNPDAYKILLPLNSKGIPVDEEGKRIEDNTIIECSYDTELCRWKILRTRYDKTFQFRVLGQPQFGNDSQVADSIWTNIHVPVTEEMIRNILSNAPDDTFEDDLYYRDNLDCRDRILKDVYGFHNRIKDSLYRSAVKDGDTLLELAVGRGGDMLKWKRTKPSKVVGIDSSSACLSASRQGACVRYLKEKAHNPGDKLPPALFICADMTQPLFDQDNAYIRMLAGTEPATTPYLSKFAGLTEFDTISCQFAIHYACESEETFRAFAGNLTKHGKGIFFGTALDGASVYSLLLGKSSHMFRAETQVFGEFKKEYDDGTGWTEEFGQAIQVHLESFEKPVREYLVPFGKVTEIMTELGYELIGSSLFADHYAQQNNVTLTQEHQAFSFLHRSFVFQKSAAGPKPKEEVKPDEVQEVQIPTTASELEEKLEKMDIKEPEAKGEEKPKAVRKKIAKEPKATEPEPEPVFFLGADEGKGEWRVFSNMHEAPFQVDSITYPTMEHYFQSAKAKVFGDSAADSKIMKTKSAKAVKSIGKKVQNFKEEDWSAKKDEIMRTGLKAKFMQHPELRAKLLETGVRPIGEADPRDKYWAIGTSSETSKAKNPTKWPGKNMLGKMLMELRAELKQ